MDVPNTVAEEDATFHQRLRGVGVPLSPIYDCVPAPVCYFRMMNCCAENTLNLAKGGTFMNARPEMVITNSFENGCVLV